MISILKFSVGSYNSPWINHPKNVRRIAHPIRVSPKSFNNYCMFKKSGTFSIVSPLRLIGSNKLSRVVYLVCKDLRSHPLLGGG